MKLVNINKIIDMLYQAQEKIEDKIYTLEDKKNALEERAGDMDRDLTSREQDLYDEYDVTISELEEENDNIQNAIDYLEEYYDC